MTNVLYDALIGTGDRPDAPFLLTDDGASLTYGDFAGRAAQLAHALVAAGVGPGDRVVVQAPKLADTVALYIATVQAGAVFLPLNNAYTHDEITYFINDAVPALVVCESADADAVRAICGTEGAAVLTMDADGTGTLIDAAAGQATTFDTVARGDDDLAALLYTSGTTGRSKGAMLTHRNLLSNARALTNLWRITSDDALIHALPIFHTHGLFVAINTSLLAGATIRFMAKFDTAAILSAMPQATIMMGVPTFYTRLLGDPQFTREAAANMRLFVSGSAPLLAETHEAFETRCSHRILERYGMTETNMITSNPYDGERVAGTVGFALPDVEVRVTDAKTGEARPVGEIGVVEVRGDNVFKGYWKMPQKTREELRDNGFFVTGDLGVLDDSGRLAIVGREKDLIISGGYNIYPKEIEDVLNDAPGVLESAVFGAPHPDFGERVLAAIVMTPGTAEAPESLAALLKEKLARFKHPSDYIFMAELPRNTMGKVQKNLLRAEHG